MAEVEVPRQNYVVSLALLQQRGIRVNTILDVGAAEGAYLLVRRDMGLFPEARHVFLDCMVENEPFYQALAGKFACDYAIGAVSSHNGDLDIAVDPGFYNTHMLGVQGRHKEYGTRRVRSFTLDSLIAERGFEAPFAMRLDLQGGELDAMRGAIKTLEQTAVVTAELQIFFEKDNLSEFIYFLEKRGFALFDITDLSYYPESSVLYQCYVTFVRRDLDYRHEAGYASDADQAAIVERLRVRRESIARSIAEATKEA